MKADRRKALVFLVGFMGVGKTTVGRNLASLLGIPFYDLDACIERRSAKRVMEIFEEGGESRFRAIETEVLKELVEKGPGVVATGGGTFTRSKNREIIRSSGISIWLDASTDMLLSRGELGQHRPLWRDDANVRALFEKRLPHYRQADLHFHLESRSPSETAEQLAKVLESHSLL
jgi:shikimate kinase